MGTLTVTTIINNVRSYLNESTVTKLTATELTSLVNDGYKDVTAKSLCSEQKIVISNIPASVRIVPLTYAEVSYNVIKVNYVEYDLSTSGGKGMLSVLPQTIGYNPGSLVPQSWFQWGDFLLVEPVPDVATYDLNVFASCLPAAAIATTDLPTSLPIEFYEDVYLFVLAFACLKLKRWADAADAYNRYIQSVQVKRAEYVLKQRDSRELRLIPDVVEIKHG